MNGRGSQRWRVLAAISVALLVSASCSGGGGGGDSPPPNQPPWAFFTATPTSGVYPLSVAFDGTTSIDYDGTVVGYRWDFGDGETGSGSVVTHRYATPGVYSVTLTVTDDDGATHSVTQSDLVQVHRTIWRFDVDKPVYYSAPAVAADGTIYFATGILLNTSSGSLYAVNPDGSLKWKYDLENSSDDDNIWTSDNNGASPAIGADGTVYLVDHRNVVYALNPDGSLKWKRKDPLESDFWWHVGQKTPAIGADGTLYVCGVLRLYALDPDDGSIVWESQELRGGNACAVSAAVGADGTVYLASNDWFYAFKPDGELKWPQPFQMDWGDEKSFSAPAIGPDGTIYFGAEGTAYDHSGIGQLYALNPDGTLKWRYNVPGWRPIRASPVIAADGTIYVTTKAYWDANAPEPRQPALCLALAPDGTLKWSYEIAPSEWIPVPQDSYSSPAIGADGTIYFGAETGFLYALNPDGTLKWKENFYNGINWSSPAILPDGTLYIGGMRSDETTVWLGRVAAIRTDSPGLAASPWPKFRRDLANAGRAD